MGVLRRLSHAFNANNIPNFSAPGLTLAPDTPTEEHGRQLHDPLHVLPDREHEPGTRTSAHPYNAHHPYDEERQRDDDEYSPSNHSRNSFDSLGQGDSNSMQPSYLESNPGNVDLGMSDGEDDEDDNEGGDKYALMTQHLYQRAQNAGWFKSKKINGMGIVSIRMKRRQYKSVRASFFLALPSPSLPSSSYHIRLTCLVPRPSIGSRTFPRVNHKLRDAEEMTEALLIWEAAVSTLNPEIAIKISSKVVGTIMARLYVKP
jgi:hypothetical protein